MELEYNLYKCNRAGEWEYISVFKDPADAMKVCDELNEQVTGIDFYFVEVDRPYGK